MTACRERILRPLGGTPSTHRRRELVGAAGLAAFGSIYAGRYLGIAVTSTYDLSPDLQPVLCLLLYVVLSSPFLRAFVKEAGRTTRT